MFHIFTAKHFYAEHSSNICCDPKVIPLPVKLIESTCCSTQSSNLYPGYLVNDMKQLIFVFNAFAMKWIQINTVCLFQSEKLYFSTVSIHHFELQYKVGNGTSLRIKNLVHFGVDDIQSSYKNNELKLLVKERVLPLFGWRPFLYSFVVHMLNITCLIFWQHSSELPLSNFKC